MKPKILGTLLFLFLLVPTSMMAQSALIKGTVSSDYGESLPGATVVEVDANNRVVNATITDLNGEYVIPVKSTKNKLKISYIGFNSETVDIGSKSTIDVTLVENLQKISEVVIKAEKSHSDGTFAIPQREVSTAVQTISTKDLEGIQVTSIDDALQGRIAGFDIVANSGDLGAGTSMRIRGTTSINANAQPLIVVNDIPYETETDPNFDFSSASQEQFANLLSINPDDIDDITVLKDASSTAVWGSKGANGVISIKTKKGVAGPTRLQYSYRLTGAKQPRGRNMLNGDEYTMLMKQAYFNRQQEEDAADIRELVYDPNFSEYENFNNNTDWIEEVSQIGVKHDHYLTVSGGGERARFRVSGGYLTQTGTVIGQRMDRISSRTYLDYSVSDRIKFITEMSFTYTDNQRNWTNRETGSILDMAYRKMPNVSVYQQDLNGNNTDNYYTISNIDSDLDPAQRDLWNPVALATMAKSNLKNYRILPTFRLHYDLMDRDKGTLQYKMYVSFDVNNEKESKFLPREVINSSWLSDLVNQAFDSDKEWVTTLAKNDITWAPKLLNPNHNFTLYGAYEIKMGNYSTQVIGNTNLPSSSITNATSEGYLFDMFSDRSSYRSNAFTGRGHYSYKGRYILGFTFRRDGSTKFGNDNKYGNFPGISAKWIISDEPWLQWSRKWVSMFAIRPSWGISGNQPRDEYLFYSLYRPYGVYIDMPATVPGNLRLSQLRWESTTSLNLGVDLGLYDDRVVFDLNFYNKLTEDLLFYKLQVAGSSGFSEIPVQNVGVMENNGWEVNMYTSRLVSTENFTWDLNFNLSNNINTIVDLTPEVLTAFNGDFNYNNGTYLSRLEEGSSFGSIYGFKYLGVYKYNEYDPSLETADMSIKEKTLLAPIARDENGNVFTDEEGEPLPMYFAYDRSNEYEFRGGDAAYEDINNDGNIDELDIVYLGNSNPKLNGGFGTNLKYKNLRLTVFFNFRYGNKIANMARMWSENMYGVNNQSKAVNWRWRKDGDDTEMPRALNNYGYNWLGSDRYIEDGSFVRLKYVTLNYAVPREKLKKLKFDNLSFYLTVNNLFVWSKYTGVDPEIGYGAWGVTEDKNSTPRSKDATLGISMTF